MECLTKGEKREALVKEVEERLEKHMNKLLMASRLKKIKLGRFSFSRSSSGNAPSEVMSLPEKTQMFDVRESFSNAVDVIAN